MASQVSPGVIIRERDLSNAVVVGASSITAAFASSFRTGPVGTITKINSERELIDTFGSPAEENAADWLVAAEYLNYGGRLAVVRAETDGLANSKYGSGTAPLIKSKADFEAGVGSSFTFAARYAGAAGNNLKVVVVDHGPDQILTFDKAPDATPVVGSTLTFASGKTATVYSYDASTKKVSVIASPAIAVGDEITETQDAVATFTSDAATEAGRTPDTYTPAADAGGAAFQVVVADAGVEAGGAATGVGGSVTVTLLSAGDGYIIGDTIVLTGASTGGGSDITVTVATIVDDETAVSAAVNWYNNTEIGSTGLKLSAIAPRPGTSAWAAERYLKNDEVHVAVVDESTNTVVERLTYLSKLSDARTAEGASNYWRTAINDFSQRIYSGKELASAETGIGSADWGDTASTYSATEASPVTLSFVTTREYALSGGDDGYEYSVGEISSAYNLFLDTEDTEIDFVLGGGSITWTTGEQAYGDAEAATLGKYAAAVALATSRADCVAFVSPYVGNQVATSGNAALTTSEQRENTIAFFDGLPSTSYAVFDSGIKYTYDRFNDKYRYIACNGDVAGLCVRTSLALDDWYSPAGVNKGALRNVVKLAYNPGKADRDDLYTSRVNPIVSLAGSGPVLFGDKTALTSPSAFDRINVRRLFLYIEKRARQLSRGVLFEQNDSLTRGAFATAMNGALARIKADRGLTDYFVVCDESNNTPAVIDANEFVAEIYLQPTRSINYVTVTLTATRTGVSFSEIIGR